MRLFSVGILTDKYTTSQYKIAKTFLENETTHSFKIDPGGEKTLISIRNIPWLEIPTAVEVITALMVRMFTPAKGVMVKFNFLISEDN